MMGNNKRYDGENLSETRESQQQKCGNSMPIANDRSQSQYQCKRQKSSVSASRNRNGETKNIIDAIARQWKTKQSVEEQQGKNKLKTRRRIYSSKRQNQTATQRSAQIIRSRKG